MARPAKPEQLAALIAIRHQVAEHGPELGPKMARADFGHISKATWSRWVAQVRAEDALFTAALSPVAAAPAPVNVEPMQPAELVVAPGVIDLFGQLASLLKDCDLLRNYAAPVDPTTGRRKVRNPMMTVQAARLRVTVLDLAQRHSESAWHIERVRAQQAQIIEAIGNVLRDAGDQALAQRIIGALRSLQDRHEASSRYLGAPGQLENAA